MKLRYLLGMALPVFCLQACSEDYMSFAGGDRIQFKTARDEVYTFAYFPAGKQKDTLHIGIATIGEIRDYPRKVGFEQVTKEWKYIYDEKDPRKIKDSVYTDMEYRALAGKHFEPIGENNELILPAGSNMLVLDIIVKRQDAALRKNAHKLRLRLLPSSDFDTGEPGNSVKNIVISDKLERPTRWKDKSYYYQTKVGKWSERKHRFMIEVIGEKWDNDFLRYIINNRYTYALRDYYLEKIKRALAEYNANPVNNPPMKDENGEEVVFP